MPRFAHIFLVIVLCTVTHGYRKDQDDDVLRVENNLEQTFQGCMLRCIDKDLCCSCKESAKLSMNAAMINDFIKTCPEADDSDCTEQWITSWMNVERGGASNCTMKDNVKKQINQCTARCKGKPMSQSLNPHHPLNFPGQFSDLSELLDYKEPDFNAFCRDIRTEGILCTVWSLNSFTAGNTRCRQDNTCGYHSQPYRWCYTDAQDHWDYCCSGSCDFHGYNYMWCQSGSKWQYCGNAGSIDTKGRKCLESVPCGMHQEIGKASYYWCYVDHNKNWGRCCEPWDPCNPKSTVSGCYTGYKKYTMWQKCKNTPEQM
ncbi:uncharacterized protein LOC132746796 [Ruditapes philippinarum]|uniref:uncharacterized protein LOC132746796 n=1 Tax=Ruditapes philippinarum TaxID=129788 RepID=UPI00295B3E27|nr:uncharacterized protein LOC132746796 [Ruditapes philippinarum]